MQYSNRLIYQYSMAFLMSLFVGATTVAANNQFNIIPKPSKISKHVYAWIGPHGGPNTNNKGFRMNMAFVIGTKSIAVIETGFYPAMAEEMVRRIREISSLPIKYAINTNSQPDRYFGNSYFEKLGVKIIAHKKEIARMKASSNNFAMFVENSMKFKKGRIKIPNLPNMPINKNINLDLGGGVILNITHFKAAHTPLPLIVSIKKDNVIYAGDILYSGRLLAIVPGGSIKEWIESFDHLRQFKQATFIPGHGAPGPLQNFEKSTYSYLKLLNTQMTKMVSEEVGMQDAIIKLKSIQSKYAYLEDFEALSGRNANLAYQEAEIAAFD